ncbi:MAG: YihY/virulence factor BrkB family protein [Deltaproteobacteria bacterium]|nr:YihY/virulence factor BrkB family protein [Candidatus Anaeroferrophillus wilburensis]MBN2889472.1 YihY/virulence factor BrkB family protein [Deltaproteobacteria bacterium]
MKSHQKHGAPLFGRNYVELLSTRIWEEPRGSFVRQNIVRLFRIVLIVLRELRKDAITLRAGALTFTVVLSLVPILALGTAVLKGLGAGNQMREAAYHFIDQVADQPPPSQRPAIEPGTGGDIQAGSEKVDARDDSPADQQKTAGEKDFAGHLRSAVDQMFAYVDRTNFATLGAIGILFLVISVIMVIGSIEEAMNVIWQVPKGRPLGRRILDYLALMILFPISINLGLGASAALHNQALLSRLEGILPAALIGLLTFRLLPFIILAGTFTLLYQFLPHAKIRFRPALVGGVGGAGGLLLAQKLYLHLQIGVARYNAIYGSFATVPLFLLWIYLGWVVFLAGAEIAFAVQVWRHYLPAEQQFSPTKHLALSLDVLLLALEDFKDRQVCTCHSLGQRLHESAATIRTVTNDLLAAGLLRRVDGNNDSMVPAGPAESMKPADIIVDLWGLQSGQSAGSRITETMMAAIRASCSHLTLKKLADQEQNNSGGGTGDQEEVGIDT